MPHSIQLTVSAASKRSDGNYGSNEVFLSETFLLLPEEQAKAAAVIRDKYLELKGRCNALIKLEPEQEGFSNGHDSKAPAGGKSEPPAATGADGVVYESKSGQKYHAITGIPGVCRACGQGTRQTEDKYIPAALKGQYDVYQCGLKTCGWRGALKKGD